MAEVCWSSPHQKRYRERKSNRSAISPLGARFLGTIGLLVCRSCLVSHSCSKSMCVTAHHAQRTWFHSKIPDTILDLILLHPLLRCFLSLGRQDGYRCPTCSWTLRHLFSALCTVIHLCINHPVQEKASLTKAGTAQTCDYKYLEGSSATWSFMRRTSKCSPLEPVTSLTMVFDMFTVLGVNSLLWSSPQIQSSRKVVSPINSIATIVLEDTSCNVQCTMWGPSIG